jgi:phosphate transport system substrate-binding protein
MNLQRRISSAVFVRSRLFVAVSLGLIALATLAVAACGDDEKDTSGGTNNSPTASPKKVSGNINGDGSSTVFPITEAVAEEFKKVQPDVNVTVGISGTGGGFKKFCNGETDFSDASRPIKDEEKQACTAKAIDYVEFQIGFDGLSVITNPSNDFVDCLTTAELKAIWSPDSKVNNWKDVRAGFPDKALKLYGPGTDSGTFDYFTEVINGTAKASRSDYTASEDDNVLVQGIEGDNGGLGYFGFAYYEENASKLKLLGVDSGTGCVEPARDTILDKTYKPLSRPLFVYVKKTALNRPEVEAFIRYFLTDGRPLIDEVGYVQSPDDIYQQDLAKLE